MGVIVMDEEIMKHGKCEIVYFQADSTDFRIIEKSTLSNE